MENVIIKTCQALDVLRIVNKLGIKDTLIELISKVNTLNTKRENVYDFATRIPQAEKEVYTCLSKIFNKDIKEIESQEFTETIEMIKTIIKSESVQVFFKLAPR